MYSLESIYKNSSWKCESIAQVKNYENCKEKSKKINYLIKTLAKFTLGRANLDVVLNSQISILNTKVYNSK